MHKYQKQNRSAFAGALVCVLLSTLFAVILQFFKGRVLDCAVAGKAQETIQYASLLIGFILLEVLFYFCYKRLGARFVTDCAKALKRDIFESILRRGYAQYRTLTQGEYIAKYTSEADTVKARRFALLPLFWEILFRILFVSAALFLLDWRIALITIALLTTPLYIPKLIEKRLKRAQTESLSAVAENLAKLNDWLAGFEVIKNYSIERKILEKFDASNDFTMGKLLHETQLGAVAQLITTLISYLSYFVVLACATWLVLAGDFSAGDFFVAIGMIDQLSYPLISLAEIIRQLVAIRPTCDSMEQFLDEKGSLPAQNALSSAPKDICFRDVSFAYEGRVPILTEFSAMLEKGKRYLLKGPSGCGKTTAVNLLLGYYPAQSGSIEVGGVPIEQAGNAYDFMTVVRQEAVLFHDTLRNNLSMYRDVPDQTLIDVLNRLGLNSFANPEALGSMIAENGANLSGGEKKRICLARALIRDTGVLILDEPLANLDVQNAGRIEDLLLAIPDKTLIVVSHQFSAEKLAKFDAVIDFGA